MTENLRFNLFYYLGVCLLLLTLASLFSSGNEVYALNSLHSPELDIYFSSITELGNSLYYLPILIVLLFMRFDYPLMFLITGLAHAIIVSIFKQVLFPMAPRPIKVLDIEQLYLVPGIIVHKIMSFPSGHTATAFAFLVLLSILFRSRLVTVLLSFIAVSVALSRVYLLQHFGIDVAVGALIGTATTIITYYSFEASRKPKWMLSRFRINGEWINRNLVNIRQLFNV